MATAAPLYGPSAEEPFALRPVPDLAGIEAIDAQGRYVGTIYGSLADATSGLIRYLDLALAETDRHVLIPIGHTRLAREGSRTEIELRAATRQDLQRIPAYDPGREEVDGAYQRRVLAAHGRIYQGERYYAHPAYDHARLFAGEHPIITESAGAEPISTLRRLSEMEEFQVASGESDIRGWPLIDAKDRQAGTIEDLLFDPDSEKVRYALLRPAVDSALTPIPVGLIEVEGQERTVRAPSLTRDDLEALPTYYPGHFNRTEEELVLRTIESRLDGERHYERPDFRAE